MRERQHDGWRILWAGWMIYAVGSLILFLQPYPVNVYGWFAATFLWIGIHTWLKHRIRESGHP